jgi:hypothetical protein
VRNRRSEVSWDAAYRIGGVAIIDALLYAVRDGIRYANIGYGIAECEIMDDGRPPPRAGNFFASIHDGMTRSDADNQLMEWYDFTVTLTMRVTAPLDRVGNQQIARNIARVPLAQRTGFYAKCDQIRAMLHMNWGFVVLTNQTPNSANDNLVAWGSGTVYGFCEPMRFLSMEAPKLVGGEWFGAEPDATDVGIKSALTFGKCRRFQPQTAPSGPFQ